MLDPRLHTTLLVIGRDHFYVHSKGLIGKVLHVRLVFYFQISADASTAECELELSSPLQPVICVLPPRSYYTG